MVGHEFMCFLKVIGIGMLKEHPLLQLLLIHLLNRQEDTAKKEKKNQNLVDHFDTLLAPKFGS